MKPQSTETKTLKPILPKPDTGVLTRVIEINAPTLPMCKCFVCDERVISSGVHLLQSTTQASNTDLPTKIGQLVGERFMVVVSSEDVLCRKCHALVNHVDKLESDLFLVKRYLINHLKKKYGLNDDQLKEAEPKEAEPEYILIQDGESEEDAEPQTKKPKVNREARYRAIKPKPSNAIELYKCSTCSFITTQSDLLACHRLVCGTLAYKCTMCDKKFDSQKMVLNHKIEAHLTKWVCHFCDINFNDEKNFTAHMKNHLGDRLNDKSAKKSEDVKKEKTLVVFQCPHCPENFEAFSQLQVHLVNHSSSVTFKCIRCNIGFQSKRKLINHIKTHDDPTLDEYIPPESPKEVEVNDTIYSCPMCSLNFLQEDVYVRHLSMHPEFVSADETGEDLNLFVEQNQANGIGNEEESCQCGEESCSKCGEKKKEEAEPVQESDRPIIKSADGNGKEPFFQQNAGEEGSHVELNHLLYVNSLNVPLTEGNVPLQNSSDDKKADTNQTEIETNSKSVEDILEKMFQVRDEDDKKKEPDDKEIPETEQEINNLKQSKNKAYVCAFSTQDLAELKQHFFQKRRGIKCWLCNKSFESEELKKHLATEHGANGANPTPTQMKRHACMHCSEKFINRRALHVHEVTHPENLRIECPDCGEKFARDKFLNEHRDEAHVISHCRMCNKAFGSVKQLKSHEARHARSDKNQFKCTGCDRVFQTATGLRHHKAIHTGEFKYKCEFCGKGFVSRVRCEEHRASHTKEERYACEICGKKFSFQATYWIHRKWHDNPTPYKCEYCGRLFKHSSLLSVHKRKHTGERPYECPHCDQSFTVGNTLKRHLMLHTGVFPFKCQVCDQGFSGKHKMAQHMSKVHQDNSLLEQQAQKKPTEYKMVVKPEEQKETTKSDAIANQTWILTGDESQGSQLLTIQTEEGESIPCTLLTDEMMGDMVNVNNRIVEIIPYDSIRSDNEDKDDEGNFIQLHGTVLGMVEDELSPVQSKLVKSGNGVSVGSPVVNVVDNYNVNSKSNEHKSVSANESSTEHFSSEL